MNYKTSYWTSEVQLACIWLKKCVVSIDFITFRLCHFFFPVIGGTAPLNVTLCCNCTSEGSDGKGCSPTCVGRGFKSILEPLRPFPLLPQPFKSNAIWQGVCFSVAVSELVTVSVTNGGVKSCWKKMSQPRTASLKSHFLQSVFVSPPPPFAEADPLIRHPHINAAVWHSFSVTGLISFLSSSVFHVAFIPSVCSVCL